jgi:phosphate-selective porin OprO/OprP
LEIGTEFFWQSFTSPVKGDPVFHGGELMASYFFNGGSRPYSSDQGNIYGYVPVKKSIFKGGAGIWEAVVRYSMFDLDDGLVHGGKFWKITPALNWYLTEFLRFELAYGYGVLDRFHLQGTTQFFQTRIQFLIR